MVGIVLPEDQLSDNPHEPVKTWVLALSTILVLCSLAFYTIILVSVPPFRELFAGFGAELPLLTKLVLDYSKYSIGLFLVGFIPLMAMWRNRLVATPSAGRNVRWVITSFGISLLTVGITFAGVYLPVIKVGAVI